MSQDISLRRRAIYTGLKPFLEEDALHDALLFWEERYAAAPRFTLQRFVAELCREGELRTRRSAVLLSLVQAMSLPVSSLLPDPLQRSSPTPNASALQTVAFEALVNALLEESGQSQHYSLRLDLLASLDPRRLPPPVCRALQHWLGNKSTLNLPGCDPDILRALVNRIYVILCERAGPVVADRMLACSVETVTRRQPELSPVLAMLL